MIDRQLFSAGRGVELDPFQRAALDALDAGRSVLVAAPTGSGKTLIAEYAIEGVVASGGKAFYTTPLKALSNQKYGDLVRRHGREQVGLLTGDNSINGEAPIVVMTTEVLRNMIYAASPTLAGLRVVVLDEVHYLQDPYRGAVWEEVIVHLDPAVRLVCLSATVANADEVASWIETVRGPTTAVVEERRPVELRDLYLAGERGSDRLHLLPVFTGRGPSRRPNPEAARLGRLPRGGSRHRLRSRLRTPSRVEAIELLHTEQMLPAIFFVFSRAGCDQAVRQCLDAQIMLTGEDERSAIREIADAHTAMLADDELSVLGYGEWLTGLEAGVAAHHAGLVPPMKEAVEEAFARGLVKVVFATETLALGINMPARSVVIEKLTKFAGERHEFLTAGEYRQLTGRAGRRGIDERGYAVVCWSPFVTFEEVAMLAARPADPLVSSFRPTYNMAVNLVRRYSPEDAHRMLNLSFAQFHADRDTVFLERELERARARLARHRETAVGGDDDGSPGGHQTPPGRATRRQVEAALGALKPGDVILVGRRNQRVVVLGREHRRGGESVLGVDVGRELRRLRPDDFTDPPTPVARVALPEPYTPRNPEYRRAVAERARRARVRAVTLGRPEGLGAPDPTVELRTRAAAAAARAEREIERLERRIRSRSASLARDLDRVLSVLEAWGYVEEWALTPAGELLAGLYSEADLLVAESLRDGLLDGLDPPELAAVVSCVTYERRGPDSTLPGVPLRWPTSRVAERAREIEARWRALAAMEHDAGLPETRPPDPGFAASIYEWARGDRLEEILSGDDLAPGDFVRQVKQAIDLLRQISEVAPSAETATRARSAAGACLRGVIAAASAVAA